MRFVILEVIAPEEVLKRRIIARKNDVSDADIEVLEYQLQNWQALSADELDHAVQIDTEGVIDLSSILEKLALV